MADIKELAEQALADAERATPGPWTPNVWIETDGNEWRATGPAHDDESHDHGSEPGCPDEQAAQRDAAWIAAARSREPQLAAAVLGLLKENERRTAAHRNVAQNLANANGAIDRLSAQLTRLSDDAAQMTADLTAERDAARAALVEACAALETWAPEQAEHLAAIAKMRAKGGV